jgi:hypothetical protein
VVLLDVWKNELEASYNCFEHFIVQSGRGAGWHHFSGLSTPVLSWYGAYHRPGRLTAGLDTWILRQEFSQGSRCLVAQLENPFAGMRPFSVLAAMEPGSQYQVTWNGSPAGFNERYPGLLEITLNNGVNGRLEVHPGE